MTEGKQGERDKMRGGIVRQGRDTWGVFVSLGRDPVSGKYRQRRETVKGTRKDAESKRREMLTALEKGDYITPAKLTVGQFLHKWLSDYAKPNVGPRTYEGYEHIIIRHLVPAFGDIPLQRLRPERIQAYDAEKSRSGRLDGKGPLSARTRRHHYVTLHDALKSAVEWGLIARNPCDSVSKPRFTRQEMRMLDEEDLHRFLEAARESDYYVLFVLALTTGLRRSELLALRWKDANLLFAELSVTRTMHHLRDGSTVFRPPKTKGSKRTIPLTPASVQVLQQYARGREMLYKGLDMEWLDEDLIFSRLDVLDQIGRPSPLLPDTVTHAWVKLVRKLGLRGIRFHDARHTHASIMLKQGVHPKVVQERLGHASIQITLDTYSHLTPSLQRDAARGFDKVLPADMVTGEVSNGTDFRDS